MNDDQDEDSLALFRGMFIAFAMVCAAGILVAILVGVIKSWQ